MKLVYNIEMSHIKEVVISHKVVYSKNSAGNYDLNESSNINNDKMPKCMSSDDMAYYVRDYIGANKWKIVLSSGTINIFKKPKKNKSKNRSV